MAAHILRLRLALLAGALRGDRRHVLRVVAAFVFVVAATVAACWALLGLRDATVAVASTVVVLGGSALTLGFAFGPLIAAADDPLDPRRFAPIGLPRGRLVAIIAVVGLVSVPVAALIAIGVCSTMLWTAHGVAWPAAVFGSVLGALTCAMLARVSTGIAALFLRERRSRELTGLYVLVVLVVVVPVGVFLASLEWRRTVPPQLLEAVDVLAVTPVGAAWAYPARVAAGADGAWQPALVAVCTLIALMLLWWWIGARLLATTERPIAGRARGGLGWFGVAPGTAGGAIAARSLLYWSRDRRHLVNLIIIPVAAAVTVVPLLVAGVPPEFVALVPVPFAALLLGWLPHNDVAYDSTALWMHVSSGVRGVSDRVGRLVPVLLIGVPLLAIAVPVAVSFHGRWAVLPALAGVSACLFLSGLGLSSISSAAAPYAVTRPGESPFQQPQRTGAHGALAQAMVMVGAIALSAPSLWWGWQALTTGVEAADTALWTGVGIGAATLVIGVGVGSAVFERRGGRLMEFVEST